MKKCEKCGKYTVNDIEECADCGHQQGNENCRCESCIAENAAAAGMTVEEWINS